MPAGASAGPFHLSNLGSGLHRNSQEAILTGKSTTFFAQPHAMDDTFLFQLDCSNLVLLDEKESHGELVYKGDVSLTVQVTDGLLPQV